MVLLGCQRPSIEPPFRGKSAVPLPTSPPEACEPSKGYVVDLRTRSYDDGTNRAQWHYPQLRTRGELSTAELLLNYRIERGLSPFVPTEGKQKQLVERCEASLWTPRLVSVACVYDSKTTSPEPYRSVFVSTEHFLSKPGGLFKRLSISVSPPIRKTCQVARGRGREPLPQDSQIVVALAPDGLWCFFERENRPPARVLVPYEKVAAYLPLRGATSNLPTLAQQQLPQDCSLPDEPPKLPACEGIDEALRTVTWHRKGKYVTSALHFSELANAESLYKQAFNKAFRQDMKQLRDSLHEPDKEKSSPFFFRNPTISGRCSLTFLSPAFASVRCLVDSDAGRVPLRTSYHYNYRWSDGVLRKYTLDELLNDPSKGRRLLGRFCFDRFIDILKGSDTPPKELLGGEYGFKWVLEPGGMLLDFDAPSITSVWDHFSLHLPANLLGSVLRPDGPLMSCAAESAWNLPDQQSQAQE